MSTAARAKVAVPTFEAAKWTPWAILVADVVALEAALGLGLGVRRMLAPWFTAAIGVDQYFAVAVGILLLPVVHYQLGIYPGYLLGPVERLRRRTLATLAVFGGLVAWDNIVARGVLSRGVLLATFVFALVLPPLAESLARKALVARKRWGIPVVMLGAGSTGRLVARTLVGEPQLGLVPIAFLDNRPDAWNQSVENVPVAGPLGLAQDFEGRAEAVIVALADLDKDDIAGLLQ
jgi:FlaA1/EpsC-like NDP-sugar epimerase